MEALLGKLLFPAESDRAAPATSAALSLFTFGLHSFTSLWAPSPLTLCSTAVEAEGRSSLSAPTFAAAEAEAGVAAAATAKALFPFDASGWFRCGAGADASVAVGIELCWDVVTDVDGGAVTAAAATAGGGSALVHSVGSISFAILMLFIF